MLLSKKKKLRDRLLRRCGGCSLEILIIPPRHITNSIDKFRNEGTQAKLNVSYILYSTIILNYLKRSEQAAKAGSLFLQLIFDCLV